MTDSKDTKFYINIDGTTKEVPYSKLPAAFDEDTDQEKSEDKESKT